MGWTRAPGNWTAVDGGAHGAGADAGEAQREAEKADDIAALISINNQLQLPEAAEGMLAFSKQLGIELQVGPLNWISRYPAKDSPTSSVLRLCP